MNNEELLYVKKLYPENVSNKSKDYDKNKKIFDKQVSELKQELDNFYSQKDTEKIPWKKLFDK